MVALLGKLEKVPFDIPEAETEIVGGTFTEYSGRLLAMFRLAIDIEMIVGASLIAAVFLPFGLGLAAPLAFVLYVLKVLFLVAVISLLRSLAARLRIDQMIDFCWKIAAPLAFVQVLVDLVVKGVLRHEDRGKNGAAAPAVRDGEARDDQVSVGQVTMPPKFRGKLAFYSEKCIGCKLCMKDCPSGAINIRKVGDKLFEADIDLSKCIYCAQCVDSCPKKALEATGDFELAQLGHAQLRITYHAEPKKPTPPESGDVKPQDGPAKGA